VADTSELCCGGGAARQTRRVVGRKMGKHLTILGLMLGNRIHLVRRPDLLGRPFHSVAVIVRREGRPFQVLHNKKVLLGLRLRLVIGRGGRELMRRVRCRAYCRWYLVV